MAKAEKIAAANAKAIGSCGKTLKNMTSVALTPVRIAPLA
jgi:hypothetical protein